MDHNGILPMHLICLALGMAQESGLCHHWKLELREVMTESQRTPWNWMVLSATLACMTKTSKTLPGSSKLIPRTWRLTHIHSLFDFMFKHQVVVIVFLLLFLSFLQLNCCHGRVCSFLYVHFRVLPLERWSLPLCSPDFSSDWTSFNHIEGVDIMFVLGLPWSSACHSGRESPHIQVCVPGRVLVSFQKHIWNMFIWLPWSNVNLQVICFNIWKCLSCLS